MKYYRYCRDHKSYHRQNLISKQLQHFLLYANCMQIIKKGPSNCNAETLCCIVWAHQGMILGPPDYESGYQTYMILTQCEHKTFIFSLLCYFQK
jgi:hypothetical protein